MDRKKHFEERGRRHPGCWYQYIRKLGTEKEQEKVYYCRYKNPNTGNIITARFRRESEGGTLARCSHYRSSLIKGEDNPPQFIKKEKIKYDIEAMWQKYKDDVGLESKACWRADKHRYEKYIKGYYRSRIADDNSVNGFSEMLHDRYGNLAPQTRKHILGLLRRIMNHSGIYAKFQMPTVKNEKTEDLNKVELGRLMRILRTDTINPDVCRMMRLELATGMRMGEVCRLQWQHCDFERKTIDLVGRKCGIDTKIPMNEAARAVLEEQAKHKKSMFVFPGKNGKQRNHITRQAKRIARLAGLPEGFRPNHGLRHYVGTELVDSGVDIYTVSKLLGHTSIKTTERYLRGREKTLKDGSEILSNTILSLGNGEK